MTTVVPHLYAHGRISLFARCELEHQIRPPLNIFLYSEDLEHRHEKTLINEYLNMEESICRENNAILEIFK